MRLWPRFFFIFICECSAALILSVKGAIHLPVNCFALCQNLLGILGSYFVPLLFVYHPMVIVKTIYNKSCYVIIYLKISYIISLEIE